MTATAPSTALPSHVMTRPTARPISSGSTPKVIRVPGDICPSGTISKSCATDGKATNINSIITPILNFIANNYFFSTTKTNLHSKQQYVFFTGFSLISLTLKIFPTVPQLGHGIFFVSNSTVPGPDDIRPNKYSELK